MHKRKIKKLSLLIFVVFEIFLLNVSYTHAWLLPSVPSVGKVLRGVESRYQINPNSVRELTATMNVAPNKANGPEVTIQYSKANPKLGDTVIATAIPTWFKNTNETLYYTWYIEHANGERESLPSNGGGVLHNGERVRTRNGNTDWNHSGAISLEDYKIEAARIIAQGGWEPDRDLNKNGDIDPGEPQTIDDWYVRMAQTYGGWSWDKEEDGYIASQGGDGFRGDRGSGGNKSYCYVQDFKEGRLYEVAWVDEGDNESWGDCDGESIVCASTNSSSDPLEWGITPGTSGEVGEDDYAGGSSTTNGECEEPPCNIKTFENNAMCIAVNSGTASDPEYEQPICVGGAPSCFSGVPVCGYIDVTADGVLITSEEGEEQFSEACSGGEVLIVADECSGSSAEIACIINTAMQFEYNHLFPQPNLEIYGSSYEYTNDNGNAFRVGKGNNGFDLRQERFWGTDPFNSDTSGNGFNDEQSVVGLGQNVFKWTYQPGDKVGVAVEGTSLATTKHEDGSSMTMFATLNNDCTPGNKSSYILGQEVGKVGGNNGMFNIFRKKNGVKIDTATVNINGCLADNYSGPATGEGEKLEVELLVSPEDPLNDPSGDEAGDILSAVAVLGNSETSPESEMLYSWEVSMCDPARNIDSNGNPSSTYTCGGDGNFDPLVNQLITDELVGARKGNGLSELKILLNMGSNYASYFVDNIGYMKIKVRVRKLAEFGQLADSAEFNSSDVPFSSEGIATATVKITSSDTKLKVYRVITTAAATGPLDFDIEVCNEPIGGTITDDTYNNKSICRVVTNEVVGLEYPGDDMNTFYWTLDGDPLNCSSDISSRCQNESQNRFNFFPITKNSGESYLVGLIATNTQTGKKVNLVKRFEVVEPFIKIEPVAGVERKLMGTFNDLEATAGIYEDWSEKAFETNPGNSVRLTAEFHPGFIGVPGANDLAMEWIKDGLPYRVDDNNVDFTVDKDFGGAYDLEFNAKYNKNTDLRRAMLELWNISQFDSEDKYLTANVKIEVVEPSLTPLRDKPKKILASMAAALPGQIIFLLRIILTIFLMLFISRAILSFSPRSAKNNIKS